MGDLKYLTYAVHNMFGVPHFQKKSGQSESRGHIVTLSIGRRTEEEGEKERNRGEREKGSQSIASLRDSITFSFNPAHTCMPTLLLDCLVSEYGIIHECIRINRLEKAWKGYGLFPWKLGDVEKRFGRLEQKKSQRNGYSPWKVFPVCLVEDEGSEGRSGWLWFYLNAFRRFTL